MKSLLVLASLIFSVSGFSLSPEAEGTQQSAYEPTIYEQLGMTSTQLFIVMLVFTVLLVVFAIVSAVSLKNATNFWMKQKGGKSAKFILLLLSLGFAGQTFAAEAPTTPTFEIPFSNEAFYIMLTFDLFLVFFILFMMNTMNNLIKNVVPTSKRKPFWSKWSRALTDVIPVENEASILLDHDYDGIKELDNNLPPWWKWGFYITIIWAVGYFSFYTFFGGTPQAEEFQNSWEDGEAEVAQYIADHPELVTEDNVELLTDAGTIGKGQGLFKKHCVTCHMDGGAGGAGPNLTDDYWIYNNTIQGVFHTISEGAENGMKSWKSDLNAREIQAVASYVLQLEPILPPLGQEPKGEFNPR